MYFMFPTKVTIIQFILFYSYGKYNDVKRMRKIEKLTSEDKSHVYAMLDAFFAKSKLQSLMI